MKAPLLPLQSASAADAPETGMHKDYKSFQLHCEEENRRKYKKIFGWGLWSFVSAILVATFTGQEGNTFGWGAAAIFVSQLLFVSLFLVGIFVLTSIPPDLFDLDDYFGFPDRRDFSESRGTWLWATCVGPKDSQGASSRPAFNPESIYRKGAVVEASDWFSCYKVRYTCLFDTGRERPSNEERHSTSEQPSAHRTYWMATSPPLFYALVHFCIGASLLALGGVYIQRSLSSSFVGMTIIPFFLIPTGLFILFFVKFISEALCLSFINACFITCCELLSQTAVRKDYIGFSLSFVSFLTFLVFLSSSALFLWASCAARAGARHWRTVLLFNFAHTFLATLCFSLVLLTDVFSFALCYLGLEVINNCSTARVSVNPVAPLLIIPGSLCVAFHFDFVKKRLFLWLAKRFMVAHKELREKGAVMAALAVKAGSNITADDLLWYKRKKESTKHEAPSGFVNRRHWMLAQKKPDGAFVVSYWMDRGKWMAQFKRTDITLVNTATEFFDKSSLGSTEGFDTWFKENFAGDASVTAEREDSKYGPHALLSPKLEADLAADRTGNYLREWAEGHFYRVNSTGIINAPLSIEVSELKTSVDLELETRIKHLLKTSPIDVKMDGDNYPPDHPFKCSEKKDNLAFMADYFISHSWDDKTKEVFDHKVACFTSFFGSAPSPSAWFDQCCLEKQKSSKSLSFASLPINIALCEKLLVALSPTYLDRLWCVWELQTVFSFDIRELSIDRVALLPIGSLDVLLKKVDAWTLDSAHCFDPNEELRMRRIFYNIGEHKFIEAVRALRECRVWGSTPPPAPPQSTA